MVPTDYWAALSEERPDPPREGPDDPELDEVEPAIAPERGTAPLLGPPE